MSASTAIPPEISQARRSRDYLSGVFAQRPSLTLVAQAMLQAWIDDEGVGSRLLVSDTWIGVKPATSTGTAYTQLITLSDALIQRCMRDEALNYTPGHHHVLRQAGPQVFEPVTAAIGVDDIELMLNTLAPDVLATFAQRWVDYWNGRVSDGVSHSRWNAVGGQLRACLLTARQNPPLTAAQARGLLGLGDEQTQQLWAQRVDREALGKPDVLRIYQVYGVQGDGVGEWLPLLVLQRRVQGQLVNLVYVPVLNLLRLL
ncbi:hypothetical protein, partial [Pseudomonas extremaustralis]|uniref:hypothetical protein n=1 Tax=Pseudomonas extremaustralis TaxID=359110 RepID=UPI0023DE8277